MRSKYSARNAGPRDGEWRCGAHALGGAQKRLRGKAAGVLH